MIALAIIGGGPAGLAAAISAEGSAELFEANPYCGKKLLLSGSGQCNFTNRLPRDEFLERTASARNFIRTAFYEFDNQALIRLLSENGCPEYVREDGKVFPQSLHSADVRDTLLRIALAKGAKIHYASKLVDIKANSAEGFELTFADGKKVYAKRVILAGGGMSYPQTGSDGSLLPLAKSLRHKIIPTRPALCGIEIKNFTAWSACAGIALRGVTVGMCSPSGRIEATGDILFTHKGFSGPVIIDNSFHLHSGSAISLTLVEDAEQQLLKLINTNPKKILANLLKLLDLPETLISVILSQLKLRSDVLAAELKATDRKILTAFLSTAVFTVKALDGYDLAMATAGGINTLEVNPRSMESRVCPGLYFAGEMLDYNLPSGGFNIQIAFSTGWLAGKHAVASLILENQA